jgi:hypothetical protein
LSVKFDVIGFQVVNADGKPVSRRYTVRDAAETLCSMLKAQGHKVYVRNVIGPAEPIVDKVRRAQSRRRY